MSAVVDENQPPPQPVSNENTEGEKESQPTAETQPVGETVVSEPKEKTTVSESAEKPTPEKTKSVVIDELKPTEIEDPAEDGRTQRRIIAEDPDWTLATVRMLNDLTLQYISSNFEYACHVIDNLPATQRQQVLDSLPTSLPLQLSSKLIDDEGFWKRSCQSKWSVCDVSPFENCWKRMYFEKVLEEQIEQFTPGQSDMTPLLEMTELAAPFVRRLNIRQLLPPLSLPNNRGSNPPDDLVSDAVSEAEDEPDVDHFDFRVLIPKLPNLHSITVTYSVQNCGVNFEWSLFQFTQKDVQALAKCIAAATQLQSIYIHRSRMDDDKCRLLISHILNHPGLNFISFPHNTIGDRGGRGIGKLLTSQCAIVELDLCDNRIGAVGAQAIAHALTKNQTLEKLNLRLNRLGDDGGQAICKALTVNTTLKWLNLAANQLSEPTAALLAQAFAVNNTVQIMDLSGNRLGPDGGKQLREGLEQNNAIIELDLRLTEVGQEAAYCIQQLLSRNKTLYVEKGQSLPRPEVKL